MSKRARTAPLGNFPEAAMSIEKNYHYTNGKPFYTPHFKAGLLYYGITADQCREAAHLLNQLAEVIDSENANKL